MSDSDDDLEVTWEVDQPKSARDVDIATGGNPGTTEPIGTPFRGGRSPSSLPRECLVEVRSGVEKVFPPTAATAAVAAAAAAAAAAATTTAVPMSMTAPGLPARGSWEAELPVELPKGEANPLKSWARHGEAVTSSRLRSVRS